MRKFTGDGEGQFRARGVAGKRRLAFVSNVGTLGQPVSKAQFNAWENGQNPALPVPKALFSHLMENFTLLVNSTADRPLSANEDWAVALRGMNPAHERFLSDQSVALNKQGRLVDRWGSPLFFHALGSMRFEIRSAGPDKTMWTADDIHRNADGSFRRGAELVAPSLLDAATRGKSPTTAP